MTWRITNANAPFRYMNSETGEINEYVGGFDGLIREFHEDGKLLGRIVEALGPDVLKRWEDGDASLDLAAEIAALHGKMTGYRHAYQKALGRIVEALGPDVLKRWEDGDASLDLAAEIAALHGKMTGYRHAYEKALADISRGIEGS